MQVLLENLHVIWPKWASQAYINDANALHPTRMHCKTRPQKETDGTDGGDEGTRGTMMTLVQSSRVFSGSSAKNISLSVELLPTNIITT